MSVEVTSKEEGALTVQKITNTLKEKRKQVPPHRPALLYMHVPAEWMKGRRTFFVFTKAIRDFYLRSRRFNAVVLVSEEVIPFLSGGFPTMVMQANYCHLARHPFTWMELFTPLPKNGRVECAESLLQKLEYYRARAKTRPDSQSPVDHGATSQIVEAN